MTDWIRVMGVVPALAVLAACGGEGEAVADQPADVVVVGAPAAQTGQPGPAAAGRVVEVRMTMANGGAFEPSQVEASPGDVIRFVNVDNVHNVSFPAASNAGAGDLPAPSPYLTGAGQTHDLAVDLAPGTYTFQCDPHAAMGMTGTLTVR